MLNTLINLFAPDLDTLLKLFTKLDAKLDALIARLQQAQATSSNKIDQIYDQIDELSDKAEAEREAIEAFQAEINRAARTKANIKGLIA